MASSCSATGAGEEARREREKRSERGHERLLLQLQGEDPDILKKSITSERGMAGHVALKHGEFSFAWTAAELDPRKMAIPDKDGNTLLHLVQGHHSLSMRLIRRCFDYAYSLRVHDRAKWCSDWKRVLVNNKGESLVYLAAFNRNFESLRCLLNTILGSNIIGPNGVTAFHVLISKAAVEDLDLIRDMIRKDTAIVTRQDNNGDSPIHHAMYHCHDPKVIEPLLEKDASTVLSVKNNDGLSPIFLAAKQGVEELIEPLVKYYREAFLETTKEGQTTCHYALIHGKPNFAVKVAELHPILLQFSDQDGNTPLHLAIANDAIIFVDCILHLINISRRYPPADHARWCLHWGLLLVNKKGESLLYLAVLRGDFKVINALLETPCLAGNANGPNGVTALHLFLEEVVAANRPEDRATYNTIISKMVQIGEILRCQDKNGNTPIHRAVRTCKELEYFNLLLEKDGSAVSILNNDGLSPIHLAIDLRNDGLSPIHSAIDLGHEEVINSFVKYCPEAWSITSKERQTACHYALIHERPSIAVKVAELDVQVLKLPDRDGNTPLHLAVASYNLEYGISCRLIEIWDQHSSRHALDDHATSYDVPANTNGESLLYLAALREDLRIINALLNTSSLKSNIDGPNGVTALHVLINKMAASNRREGQEYFKGVIQDMVKIEGILRRQDNNGDSLLHHTVYSCKDLDVIDLLLKTDASIVSISNNAGVSPVHLAAQLGRKDVMSLFVRYSTDAFLVTTAKKQNTLHIAMERRHTDLALEILALYKNPSTTPYCSMTNRQCSLLSQRDENGDAPLHIASSKGDFSKFKQVKGKWGHLLLFLRNNEGRTIVDIVNQHEEDEKRTRTERWIKAADEMKSGLLVVTNLITTVTFTAAFTLPGGYNGDNPHKGMATLVEKGGFKLFLVADMFSLCSSVLATGALIKAGVVHDLKNKVETIAVAFLMLFISLSTLLLAFVAGVWVVVGFGYRWLLILIVIAASLCLCVPIVMLCVDGRKWAVRSLFRVIRQDGQGTQEETILTGLQRLKTNESKGMV